MCLSLSDSFCSVSENHLQFAVFPACMRNTANWPQQQTPRWIPGIHCCFFDLQWPLLCLPTGEERLSEMWWLIRWTVKCRWRGTRASRQNWAALGGWKCARGPPMRNCQSDKGHLLSFALISAGSNEMRLCVYWDDVHAARTRTQDTTTGDGSG